MLVVAAVQSFYSPRPRTLFIDRALQLYGSTSLAIVAFLPLPILAITLAVPLKRTPDPFGCGRLHTKVAVLVTGTVLVAFSAAYRCGTAWLPPVRNTAPFPAYFHKAAFYIIDFAVEIITFYLYAFMRLDQRFYIPDGACGPGSYSQQDPLKSEIGDKEGDYALN
jgi:hypothetical protein